MDREKSKSLKIDPFTNKTHSAFDLRTVYLENGAAKRGSSGQFRRCAEQATELSALRPLLLVRIAAKSEIIFGKCHSADYDSCMSFDGLQEAVLQIQKEETKISLYYFIVLISRIEHDPLLPAMLCLKTHSFSLQHQSLEIRPLSKESDVTILP